MTTLLQMSKRSAKPSYGDPVRIRQKTSLRIRRLSAAVTSGSVAFLPNVHAIRVHMASVSTFQRPTHV